MNLALNSWFFHCYNTRILTAKLSPYYLLTYYSTMVYNRTITRFITDKVVYQRVRQEMRLRNKHGWMDGWMDGWMASDNSWARRRLKHLSRRSCWLIVCTLGRRMGISLEIPQADRCLFGLSSRLSTRPSTARCWRRSVAAWLPDNNIVPSCGFSSADYRWFQVSNPCRTIHSTALVQPTALTDRNFNQNRIFLWKFHDFV